MAATESLERAQQLAKVATDLRRQAVVLPILQVNECLVQGLTPLRVQ